MDLWRSARASSDDRAAFHALVTELGVEARATALLEAYKEQAIRSLPALHNASLKGLLRRVVGKVFRVEIKGWCSEFEARDAAGRQAGAQQLGESRDLVAGFLRARVNPDGGFQNRAGASDLPLHRLRPRCADRVAGTAAGRHRRLRRAVRAPGSRFRSSLLSGAGVGGAQTTPRTGSRRSPARTRGVVSKRRRRVFHDSGSVAR